MLASGYQITNSDIDHPAKRYQHLHDHAFQHTIIDTDCNTQPDGNAHPEQHSDGNTHLSPFTNVCHSPAAAGCAPGNLRGRQLLLPEDALGFYWQPTRDRGGADHVS